MNSDLITAGAAHVAFCADEGVLEPLQVAVASLVEHASGDLTIHLGRDFDSVSLVPLIEPIVEVARRNNSDSLHVTLEDLSLNLVPFRKFQGLHGNWMTYGRLLLPDLLPDVSRCIYLDADLIVRDDIRSLFELEIGRNLMAGVAHTKLAHATEQEVWRRFALDLESPYFNAGVLLMNLQAMREHSTLNGCVSFLAAVQDCFAIVDQTALIVVCNGRWHQLGAEWNHAAWPGDPVGSVQAAKIVHYIGSPKPWDVGGRWINPQGVFYREVRDRYSNVIQSRRTLSTHVKRWSRAVRLARSYWGAIRKRPK